MITQTELTARLIAAKATNSLEYIVADLIKSHNTSDMTTGVEYYDNDPAINDRQIYFFNEAGQRQVDADAINYKVPHNWHKLLVDQKVGYLLGRPPVIRAEPDAYSDELNKWLDEQFDDCLQELGRSASNKGVEYLHCYIDEEGVFQYVVIPAEQVVAVYDTDYQQNIVALVRYYPFWINGEEVVRAEYWDKDTVTYFIGKNGEYVMENTGAPNPDSHFYYGGKGYGWGRVPFVEFKNNADRKNDLTYYRELIDVYDLIVSDLANDVVALQKLAYVLRGYEGTSMKEFVENLRRFRAIKVSGDQGSGVDILQADIPIAAINALLDRTEENIFLFGQGANVKTDKFGSAPSGVALKFLYALLDLKCQITARKFVFAIKSFCWFLTEYLTVSGTYAVPKGAFDTIRVTFVPSLLTNDKEVVEIATMSKGVISDQTIVANHPWVEDAVEELDRLDAEKEANAPDFTDLRALVPQTQPQTQTQAAVTNGNGSDERP